MNDTFIGLFVYSFLRFRSLGFYLSCSLDSGLTGGPTQPQALVLSGIEVECVGGNYVYRRDLQRPPVERVWHSVLPTGKRSLTRAARPKPHASVPVTPAFSPHRLSLSSSANPRLMITLLLCVVLRRVWPQRCKQQITSGPFVRLSGSLCCYVARLLLLSVL